MEPSEIQAKEIWNRVETISSAAKQTYSKSKLSMWAISNVSTSATTTQGWDRDGTSSKSKSTTRPKTRHGRLCATDGLRRTKATAPSRPISRWATRTLVLNMQVIESRSQRPMSEERERVQMCLFNFLEKN